MPLRPALRFWPALLGLLLLSGRQSTIRDLDMVFFGQPIPLRYDEGMVLRENVKLRDAAIVRHYERVAAAPHQVFLQHLLDARARFQLNDWLYARLLMQALEQMYGQGHEPAKAIALWQLLCASGYDARVAYQRGDIWVYARTEEALYEVPMFEERGQRFANLSAIVKRRGRSSGSLFTPSFRPNPQGRPLGFAIRQWPRFPPKPLRRSFSFAQRDSTYSLSITLDQTAIDIMADYPALGEVAYIETPHSALLRASLLPALRELTEGMDWEAKLRFLLAFTRGGLAYKKDEDAFGENRQLSAEETLFYPYSDCEDRVALFVSLSRELLGLPTVVVAWDDHLSAAIALPKPIGHPIRHQGQAFSLCDPTGPDGSDAPGIYPKGYDYKEYNILHCIDC